MEGGPVKSKHLWKSDCKNAIQSLDQYIHKLETEMYKKSKYVRDYEIGKVSPWWQASLKCLHSVKSCSFMVKLLIGEEPLHCNKAVYDGDETGCKICTTSAKETVIRPDRPDTSLQAIIKQI